MSRARVIWAAVLSALLTTVTLISHAATAWNAVGLGLVAFALWLATRSYHRTEVAWPRDPRQDRPGGRTDVAELSWAAFTRNGLVTERVLRRVRAIAARRLAAHGVLWDGNLPQHTFRHGVREPEAVSRLRGWGTGPADAAEHLQRARDLLGASTADDLTTARAATPRTLDHWFRVLDALVEPGTAQHPDDSRSTR